MGFSVATKVHLLLPTIDLAASVKYLQMHGPKCCSYIELPLQGDMVVPEDHQSELKKAEILMTTSPVLGGLLYSLPKLKWAQLTFAGVETLMKFYQPDKPAPPFAVTRMASASFGRELAEWVLAAVLGHERGFHRLWAAQRQHRWADEGYTYRPLCQLTVGIMGTGQMGTQAGTLFKMLGCKVYGLARTEKAPNEIFDRMFRTAEVAEFLRAVDYACNLLPSTAATRGLLTPAVLEPLLAPPRRGPVLVNAGRGDLVAEPMLVEALRRGWLAGAVLDVFETEPLPADSPLWDMEEVTISPHVGNLSRPEEACAVFVENLQRYLRRDPLLYQVDWSSGY